MLAKICTQNSISDLQLNAPVDSHAPAVRHTRTLALHNEGSWYCTGPCPRYAMETTTSTSRSTDTLCLLPQYEHQSHSWSRQESSQDSWCSTLSDLRRTMIRRCRHRRSDSWRQCSSKTCAPGRRNQNAVECGVCTQTYLSVMTPCSNISLIHNWNFSARIISSVFVILTSFCLFLLTFGPND